MNEKPDVMALANTYADRAYDFGRSLSGSDEMDAARSTLAQSLTTLQSKLDAAEARDALEKLEEAAYEWSGYVVEDTAPRTLSAHLEPHIGAIRAALSKEPK